MFNLKAKILRRVAHYKLHPLKYETYSAAVRIYSLSGDTERDCTQQMGLVGLKPLTLAFVSSFDPDLDVKELRIKQGSLLLSSIGLERSTYSIPGYSLYAISQSSNEIQSVYDKVKGRIGLWIKNILQPNKNFVMPVAALLKLYDFCVYPRPVYIVSGYQHGHKFAFPIDVVGLYGEGSVLFSVRKTSAANAAITQEGKILLSKAPYSEYKLVYELGKNNYARDEKRIIDFETQEDQTYPSFCSHVVRVRINSVAEIGEHYCYAGFITAKLKAGTDAQLTHVPWFVLPFLDPSDSPDFSVRQHSKY